MAVLDLERYVSKTMTPVQIKNEDEIKYNPVDRRVQKGDFQLFKVEPELNGKRRVVERLAQDDVMGAIVHKIAEGGETNLHCHRSADATWLVLEGQVTFYDENNEVIAALNEREGVFIPRGKAYWFQSTSKEPSIIFRVSSRHPNIPNERFDYGTAFQPHD
ncbi:MAG TPA: cupin domain-containing protein [Chloroflexota bacterium]|nr:cupin domain-containing protein [Chloroflexota bacterium]